MFFEFFTDMKFKCDLLKCGFKKILHAYAMNSKFTLSPFENCDVFTSVMFVQVIYF